MADQPTIYDLVLLLDSEAPEEQRQRVLSGVQSAIATAGGSVDRNDGWGRRPLSFEIRHRPEAEYHLLQFQAPGPSIEELSHTLRITDGVLRFRIIKVRPGTPEVRPGAPPVVAAVAGAGGSSSTPSSEASAAPAAAEAPSEEAPAAEAAPAAEEAPASEASADTPAEADQAGSGDAAAPGAEQASEETAGEDS